MSRGVHIGLHARYYSSFDGAGERRGRHGSIVGAVDAWGRSAPNSCAFAKRAGAFCSLLFVSETPVLSVRRSGSSFVALCSQDGGLIALRDVRSGMG